MNRGQHQESFKRIHPKWHVADKDDVDQFGNSYELTVATLQDLLIKDPSDITLSLSSNFYALRQILDQSMDYNFAALFVKVLGKSMQSNSLKENNNHILSILLESKFPLNISALLVNINYSTECDVEFLLNLIFILKKILIQNPSESVNTLQIIGVISVILEDPDQISNENTENLLEKYKELQRLLQQMNKKKRNKEPEQEVSSLTEIPPEDFRDLEIVPTAEAIHSEEPIFLRKNKVKGAYDDVDHYLDVQFRLMREDFFGPLRDGIKLYLSLENEQKHQQIDGLRFYHEVHILYSLCTLNGISHKVSFDVSKLQVNWEVSKRLIYGSLVCLTSDDFQTVYFATVKDRKINELKEGLVDLLFFSSCEDIARISSTTTFIMAETKAYFEAYRPILTALKEIREDDIPFQDYIIYGKSEVKAPKYLTQQTHLQMDLTCLTEDCHLVFDSDENIVKIKENFETKVSLNILEDAWPDAKTLKLRPSRNQAFQNALTKEFSLTRGSSVNGETYIGLKIVKALCSNCNLWRNNSKSPMLIVCHTNQALDKFLEGIASFLEGGILRVGDNGKNEVLSKYLLKNRRHRKNNCFSNELPKRKNETMEQLKTVTWEIEKMSSKIRLTKRGILHEDIIKDHMGQFYDWLVESFQVNFGSETNGKISVMTQWLGYGNIDILDKPNVEQEVDDNQELLAEEDEVDINEEADVIQYDHMMDDETLVENFSDLEIIDDQFLAMNIDDSDKESIGQCFQRIEQKIKGRRNQLHRDLNSNTLLKDEEVDQIHYPDLWLINKEKRWKLYRRWIASYCQKVRDEIVQKEVEYNRVTQCYKEVQQHEDGEIMKNSLIIGMTTTAAAKYHALLQEIQPKIIIVEEAAKISEAHVVTALNPMCEQLILIGNPKEIHSNANVYELAHDYNLKVSLYQRMALNQCRVKCTCKMNR